MDLRGLEPLTFPMPWGRATNYAMGPQVSYFIKFSKNILIYATIYLVTLKIKNNLILAKIIFFQPASR